MTRPAHLPAASPRPPARRPLLLAGLAALGGGPGIALGSGRAAAQPVAAELDAALLSRGLELAAALPGMHSLIVARNGAVVLEKVFRGPGPSRPANIKSASKSVLSALVGIAIGRGVLRDLDQPIVPILGPLVPRDADPRLREVTLGHLLSMRSGLERTSGANYGAFAASRDWVRFILSRPMEDEPGGRMLYSTGNTHLLSVILTRASGRSTLELARDWLGRPLAIEFPPWPRDPQGYYFGGNDMLLTPRALLRFGEMFRAGGTWEGRTVVPADWVRQSWTPQARSPWSGGMYGLGWWIGASGGQEVFYAWGFGGQMLYVVPGLGMTVAMTSAPDGPRIPGQVEGLHAVMAQGLIPAAQAAQG